MTEQAEGVEGMSAFCNHVNAICPDCGQPANPLNVRAIEHPDFEWPEDAADPERSNR